MPGAPVLLLDPAGGSLALLKERDEVTWPADYHRQGVSAADGAVINDGASFSAQTVDVSGYRNGAIRFWPSDPAATYSVAVYSLSKTGPRGAHVNGVSGWDNLDARMSLVDGVVLENLVGNQNRAVSWFGHSYVWVMVTALSVGTLDIEVGYNEYETVEED